jgi:hypothetical protein
MSPGQYQTGCSKFRRERETLFAVVERIRRKVKMAGVDICCCPPEILEASTKCCPALTLVIALDKLFVAFCRVLWLACEFATLKRMKKSQS